MTKDRYTQVELCEKGNESEYVIEIDDKAATRQAIINYIEKNLELNVSNKFLERSEWHAKSPKKPLEYEWDYDSIVIHHQGNLQGWNCEHIYETANNTQQLHINQKNFDDIGYHYIVSCDGLIAEGRDIRFKGSHVLNNNSKKIGILLSGDYSERNESHLTINELSHWNLKSAWKRREELLESVDVLYSSSIPIIQEYSLRILISSLLNVFCISKLGGHREFALSGDKRTCPGNIAMSLIHKLRIEFNLSISDKGVVGNEENN